LNRFEEYFINRGEFKNLELTLDRINNAVKEAGSDLNRLGHVIHIAGTNGKGSTAYFLNQILKNNGATTALFTSPHITSINERIKLNMKNVSDEKFDDAFEKTLPLIEKHDLSYFEALFLIAIKIFNDEAPDFTILETGLGGRYDATNIINKKTPVITTIAQDHKQWLGKNIYNIADEKFAIIKENRPVFTGNLNSSIFDHLKKIISSDQIISAKKVKTFGIPKPYDENYMLAHTIAEHLMESDLPFYKVKLPPCRNEKIGNIVLDGSHNPAGLYAFLKNNSNFGAVILASTCDRDLLKLADIAKSFCPNVILTSIPENDRSTNLEEITCYQTYKNPDDALKIAVELSTNTDILVSGSLYLCAYIRKTLKRV